VPTGYSHIQTEVELDGSQSIQLISSVVINQYSNWHHNFEVRGSLDNVEGENAISFNKSHKLIGKSIKIAFKADNSDEQLNLFKGIITEVNLSRYGGTAADIIFRGFSTSILMDDGPHCMSFFEKPLKDVVSTLTGKYPQNVLNSKVKPTKNPTIPYIVQYNESAYNFLSRLASVYGQWFYYNGIELIFGGMESTEPVELSFGHDLTSFQASLRVAPMNFEAYSYDYVTNKVLKAPSSGATVAGLDNWGKKAMSGSESLYGTTQSYSVKESVKDDAALKDIVLNRKSALAGELVKMTGVSSNPSLRVGMQISVRGGLIASQDDDVMDYGSYTITQVSHHTDSLGSYSNKFEAIPGTLGIPPYNTTFKEPMCETQQAVVVDNKDPEGMGRIKVKFAWYEAEPSCWMRYVTSHAGKDRGMYWLPEVNDEVVVAFEGNNPSRPYALGSYYHGKAHSSDRKEDSNLTKTIRTASGNELTFFDKGGEESIHLFNKDKKNELLITMKDDGLIKIVSNKMIKIEAKEDIKVKAKNMKFEASGKIEFKADEFKVKAQSLIQLESMKDWKAEGMEVAIEATANFGVKANANIEMKANVKLDLSSSATASLKANAQLELSGMAMATLKGGMVMIN